MSRDRVYSETRSSLVCSQKPSFPKLRFVIGIGYSSVGSLGDSQCSLHCRMFRYDRPVPSFLSAQRTKKIQL